MGCGMGCTNCMEENVAPNQYYCQITQVEKRLQNIRLSIVQHSTLPSVLCEVIFDYVSECPSALEGCISKLVTHLPCQICYKLICPINEKCISCRNLVPFYIMSATGAVVPFNYA
jgi:hypothetical protein